MAVLRLLIGLGSDFFYRAFFDTDKVTSPTTRKLKSIFSSLHQYHSYSILPVPNFGEWQYH
ncbi:hypothetical protein J4421_00700 [Candidatus Woesearchaeota archaeon]|nr:hypothetical protein [Candidatus Woesearchaeota archaeon]